MSRKIDCFRCNWSSREESGVFLGKSGMMSMCVKYFFKAQIYVILVCDNLNTHTRGAFYQAFPPEKAREIVKRIEIRYTPKHGS